MSFKCAVWLDIPATDKLKDKVKEYTDHEVSSGCPKLDEYLKNCLTGHSALWHIPEVLEEMNNNVSVAEQRLDNQMKGWKPCAVGYSPRSDGKGDTQYGIYGGSQSFGFDYQRWYTK